MSNCMSLKGNAHIAACSSSVQWVAMWVKCFEFHTRWFIVTARANGGREAPSRFDIKGLQPITGG
jgi:hypothetical protein